MTIRAPHGAIYIQNAQLAPQDTAAWAAAGS
jgi:hypothetical protein